jgi:hypothetical protein
MAARARTLDTPARRAAAGRVRESLLRFWSIRERWERLRQRIADDEALMALVASSAAATVEQDQTWRVLFAAVAYLSRKHHFPIGGGTSRRSFARLRARLLEHSAELIPLLQRPAQVNEPLRCIGLYAGLLHVAQQVAKPIALVEVGPSLGLNLCMDRYAYDYRGICRVGALGSSCRLAAEVIDRTSQGMSEAQGFALPSRAPVIKERIGLELNPVSLDPDSLAWMRAFHFQSSELRFDAALAIRKKTRIRILEGDASRTLTKGLSLVPNDRVPLVFHTSTAYQMSHAVRARLAARLASLALRRRIFYMTLAEEPARRGALLQVTDLNLERGEAPRRILGFVTRWAPLPRLEWVQPALGHAASTGTA